MVLRFPRVFAILSRPEASIITKRYSRESSWAVDGESTWTVRYFTGYL